MKISKPGLSPEISDCVKSILKKFDSTIDLENDEFVYNVYTKNKCVITEIETTEGILKIEIYDSIIKFLLDDIQIESEDFKC